jgi:transcriptional regulator GlxA family with amidase domain
VTPYLLALIRHSRDISILAIYVRFLAELSLAYGSGIQHNRKEKSNWKGPFVQVNEPRHLRHLAFLILPQVQILDLAGPVQVFDTAARQGGSYRLTFCSTTPEVEARQHLCLAHLEPLPDPELLDMVLIPGIGGLEAHMETPVDAMTCAWLQKCSRRGVSIASICTGAAVLGEAGLLHGRRCTTHWNFIAELQRLCPTAHVLDNVLYVQDRGVTTSAGVASGIDMALWLLEQECGPRFAAAVARYLVVYLRRSGLDRQVSSYLEYRSHLDPRVHQIQDWLGEHITETICLAELAEIAQTSERSLTRAFKAATGITPHVYQQLLRLELAAQLVNDSHLSLETIAARTGFGDARHFRRVWHHYFGAPPSAERTRAKASSDSETRAADKS